MQSSNRPRREEVAQASRPMRLWAFLCAALCGFAQPGWSAGKSDTPPGVTRLGMLANPGLIESSGVAASRQHAGVLWTHNDGGGKKASLYAIDRTGANLGRWLVVGAAIRDWEDIAIDDQNHLYVADVGNNDAKRETLAVYQVDEPDPKAGGVFVQVNRGWVLRFSDKPFDCESFFIWKNHGYLISKVFNDRQAEIYRFPLASATGQETIRFVARLKISSPVTGAALSADGKQLGVVAQSGAFFYRIDGDVSSAADRKPFQVRFKDRRIEGCCFVPEGLLATSEKGDIFLFSASPFLPLK
jgi:hypothetical protein